MKNVCLQRKLISSFLLFLIGFCTFPTYAEDVDSLPPIIGPWSYSALRCNGIVGVWTSEAEALQQGIRIIYGPTVIPDGSSSGWGTATRVVSGPCGSTNVFPGFNKMGIETLNYNHVGVEEPGAWHDGISIRRERSITCPPGTTDNLYSCKINNFVVYLAKINPEPKCPDNPTDGNPVLIANGSKFELTEPVVSGNLKFQFTYNNGDRTAITPWYHTYQKTSTSLSLLAKCRISIKKAVFTIIGELHV